MFPLMCSLNSSTVTKLPALHNALHILIVCMSAFSTANAKVNGIANHSIQGSG